MKTETLAYLRNLANALAYLRKVTNALAYLIKTKYSNVLNDRLVNENKNTSFSNKTKTR
jgi:hypothetical protein